jgi:methylenetetrahydrofolate reductase (NADPH)
MKIGDFLKTNNSLSFEFFPPKDEMGADKLFEHINKLKSLNPDFVSVTCGAGGSTSKNTRQTINRIKKNLSITAMPHITCINQNKQELSVILQDYKNDGVENILALRGDPPKEPGNNPPTEDSFHYARELVELAVPMSAFSIAVAVYPEGHSESSSIEADIEFTKQKIDAGADFAMTQMFFDNHYFYDFLERMEKENIKIPVVPGIMPITDINRIKAFSVQCGATLPQSIIKKFEEKVKTPEESIELGIELATEQCNDLRNNGVRYFHFYTLNQSAIITRIVQNLDLVRYTEYSQ